MPNPIKTIRKKHIAYVGIGIFILLLIAAGSYFAYRSIQLSEQIDKLKGSAITLTEAEAKRQAALLKKEISSYLLLPEEEPTIATVLDVTALSANPFFKNAKNGDKVLVFPQAQKAIIYRQEEKKIIEVGFFNPGTNEQQNALDQQTIPVTKVALWSATGSLANLAPFEKILTQNFPTVTVAERTLAKKNGYKTSTIVDVTGKNREEVQSMSTKLDLTISTLPQGESTPAGDILIVVTK